MRVKISFLSYSAITKSRDKTSLSDLLLNEGLTELLSLLIHTGKQKHPTRVVLEQISSVFFLHVISSFKDHKSPFFIFLFTIFSFFLILGIKSGNFHVLGKDSNIELHSHFSSLFSNNPF